MHALFAAPQLNLMSTEFLVSVGLFILVLLIGAVALAVMSRWQKRTLDPRPMTAQTLSDYREMFEQGEISEDEYLAIRAKMASKIQSEVVADNAAQGIPAPRKLHPPSEQPGKSLESGEPG